MQLLRKYSGFRTTWTNILDLDGTGRFLLFYDKSSGHGEFFSIDNNGNLYPAKTYRDWRKTWDIITPTPYIAYPGMLFYDRGAGEAELHTKIQSEDVPSLKKKFSGWRKTWSQIVPSFFRDTYFFYDRQAGEAEMYFLSPNGDLSLLRKFSGLRKTWDIITPIDTRRQNYLLFYDRLNGHGEIYGLGPDYSMQLVFKSESWRKTWSEIKGEYISFGSSNNSEACNLFFHDESNQVDELFFFQPGTWIARQLSNQSWSRSWSEMVSSVTNSTHLLFLYNRSAGTAEVVATYQPSPTIRSFYASPNTIQVCQETQITLNFDVLFAESIAIAERENSGSMRVIADIKAPDGMSVWKGSVVDSKLQSAPVDYRLTAYGLFDYDNRQQLVFLNSQWPIVKSFRLRNNSNNVASVSIIFNDGTSQQVTAALQPDSEITVEVPHCRLVVVKARDLVQNFVRWESSPILGNDLGSTGQLSAFF